MRDVETGVVVRGRPGVWMSVSAVPIPLKDGAGTLVSSVDITQSRRTAEEKAPAGGPAAAVAEGRGDRPARRRRGARLQQPDGDRPRLRRDAPRPSSPGGSRARRYAEQIVAAGRRSAALTRQLLAFSRKQMLQPEVLDLNALLRNLEQMLGRLIGEDIELAFRLARRPGPRQGRPGPDRAGPHEPRRQRPRRDAAGRQR